MKIKNRGLIFDFMQDYNEDKHLDGAVEVRIDTQFKMPEYTFKQHGNGSCPRGDIVAIKAKSKNGKTFLSSLFAAIILGADVPYFDACMKRAKVIYFDTEQNPINTYMVVKRIYTLCGWKGRDNRRFKAFNLRCVELRERMGIIERRISENKPTAVFIDGIADLVNNFNDIDESNNIIQNLMRISAANKCAIFVIIHTNKGKDDNSMKGHLGTIAWQKCSDVFNVEKKNDDTFFVTETDCRNKPISDFSFKIDEDGIPFIPKTSK